MLIVFSECRRWIAPSEPHCSHLEWFWANFAVRRLFGRLTNLAMKPTNDAALGFRAHSGWAAAVVLGGPAASPKVIDRRRIELVKPGTPGGVQPYHAARELPFAQAEQLIHGAIASAGQAALLAVRFLAKQM